MQHIIWYILHRSTWFKVFSLFDKFLFKLSSYLLYIVRFPAVLQIKPAHEWRFDTRHNWMVVINFTIASSYTTCCFYIMSIKYLLSSKLSANLKIFYYRVCPIKFISFLLNKQIPQSVHWLYYLADLNLLRALVTSCPAFCSLRRCWRWIPKRFASAKTVLKHFYRLTLSIFNCVSLLYEEIHNCFIFAWGTFMKWTFVPKFNVKLMC